MSENRGKQIRHVMFGITLLSILSVIITIILQVMYLDIGIIYPMSTMITGAGTVSAAYITADMASVIVTSASMSPGQKANISKFVQYLIICILWFTISVVLTYLFTNQSGNAIYDSTISWQQAFLSGGIMVGMMKGNKIAGSAYSEKLGKMMETFKSTEDVSTKSDEGIDEGERPD